MERIKAAIKTRETLDIIYHGGSQPGTLRAIIPCSIRDDKLLATCISSQTNKTFLIEKVEVIEGENKKELEKYNPLITKKKPHYQSIDDLLNENREFLETLGWHVDRRTEKFKIKDSHEQNCEYLALHSHFKNGKLRKAYDVELSFEALTWDEFADSGEENIKKRTRPWIVRGKKRETKSYGSLDKAASLFLDWAVTSSPAS